MRVEFGLGLDVDKVRGISFHGSMIDHFWFHPSFNMETRYSSVVLVHANYLLMFIWINCWSDFIQMIIAPSFM